MEEEAGVRISTECLQLSLLFIHPFFLSHEIPHTSPQMYHYESREEEIDSIGAGGTLKGELSSCLSSNYYHSMQSCSTEREKENDKIRETGILFMHKSNIFFSPLFVVL